MHIAEQKLQSAPTFIGHHFPLFTVWRKCSQIFQFLRDFFSLVLRKFILSSFEEICSLQFWGNISSPVLRKFILSSFVEIYPACSSSGTNSLRPASISASWAWWGWLGWWSSSSWSWSRWSWCIFAKCIFPKSLLSISDKHLKCFIFVKSWEWGAEERQTREMQQPVRAAAWRNTKKHKECRILIRSLFTQLPTG